MRRTETRRIAEDPFFGTYVEKDRKDPDRRVEEPHSSGSPKSGRSGESILEAIHL